MRYAETLIRLKQALDSVATVDWRVAQNDDLCCEKIFRVLLLCQLLVGEVTRQRRDSLAEEYIGPEQWGHEIETQMHSFSASPTEALYLFQLARALADYSDQCREDPDRQSTYQFLSGLWSPMMLLSFAKLNENADKSTEWVMVETTAPPQLARCARQAARELAGLCELLHSGVDALSSLKDLASTGTPLLRCVGILRQYQRAPDLRDLPHLRTVLHEENHHLLDLLRQHASTGSAFSETFQRKFLGTFSRLVQRVSDFSETDSAAAHRTKTRLAKLKGYVVRFFQRLWNVRRTLHVWRRKRRLTQSLTGLSRRKVSTFFSSRALAKGALTPCFVQRDGNRIG